MLNGLPNLPNTCSTAVLNGLPIAIIEMSHPIIYRERIAIGPLRKDKVTEWIWIGWCLCEVSEAQVQSMRGFGRFLCEARFLCEVFVDRKFSMRGFGRFREKSPVYRGTHVEAFT